MAYRRSTLMQKRLDDNRRRIARAARRLIGQGGFREATVSAVAQAAGLSTGAIYRYFPSKADLFVEVLNDAVDHEVMILRRITERNAPHASRLRAAVASFAGRALQGPHLAYAFIAEPTDTEVEAARILCRGRFAEVFRDLLVDGIGAGAFPPQAVDVTAACIVGAFTEALVRPVAPTAHPGDDVALVDQIVDFCARAVGAVTSSSQWSQSTNQR
jgi:AcrR family transcriptional regulator